MISGQHISRRYSEELEAVRNRVLHMGGIVEEQVANAIGALVEGHPRLARQVVLNDDRINSLEIEIDAACTRIMALRQPAASDLRLVMTALKTISDLERIGDEAKRVGKMVVEELGGSLREEVRQEIEHMGGLVREMLRLALDAFARSDVDAAVRVIGADRKVDSKYVSITRQLVTYMAADPGSIPTVLNILWAARAMERMGDRCQNIAEYVFYLVHGRDIRHARLEDVVGPQDAG
jgi:phosphate transport system protein